MKSNLKCKECTPRTIFCCDLENFRMPCPISKKSETRQNHSPITLRPGSKGTFTSAYMMGDKIDEGSFGSVWRAYKVISPDAPFAVKIFNLKGMQEKRPVFALTEIRNEIAILQSINHRGVITYEDHFESATEIHMVTEYVAGGRLYESIVENEYYSESMACDIVIDILEVLVYLHERRIVYRDLKPENLLLMGDDDLGRIKFCDFGFAKQLEPGTLAKGLWYTPGYGAPEVLKDESYDMKVDVFSAGVVTYIMLTGCVPWHESTWEDDTSINDAVTAGAAQFDTPEWHLLSSYARDFVVTAMCSDPNTRPTAEALLSHPWVTKASKGSAHGSVGTSCNEFLNFLTPEGAKSRIRDLNKKIKASINSSRLFQFFHTASKQPLLSSEGQLVANVL